MRTYKANVSINDFIQANNAVEIDCVEGCLIDNYLLSTDTETIFLQETYQNCWTSIYTVYRADYGNDSEVFDRWYELKDAIEKEG